VSPSGGGDGAAAIVVATTIAADGKLSGFQDLFGNGGIVAMMTCLADATGMRRGSGGCQRQGNKSARQHDQQ
jgi:hypothetical protein